MKKKTIVSMISYAVTAAVLVIALFFSNFSIEMITFSAVVAVFALILLIRETRNKKLGIIIEDELSEIIALKSFRNSWLATVSVLCISTWFNFFHIELPASNQIIVLLLFVMIFSFHLSRIIYSKKLQAE